MSYNISCALTGLSINPGDPATVLLCTTIDNTNQLIKISPLDFESPLTPIIPPIVGEYGGYGNLHWKIENNPHLAYLNNRHNINYHITQYDGNNIPTQKDKELFPQKLFAVWIHGTVYKKIIETSTYDWWTLYVSSSLLEFIGFETIQEDDHTIRYSRPDWEEKGFHLLYKDNSYHTFYKIFLCEGNTKVAAFDAFTLFDTFMKEIKFFGLSIDDKLVKENSLYLELKENIKCLRLENNLIRDGKIPPRYIDLNNEKGFKNILFRRVWEDLYLQEELSEEFLQEVAKMSKVENFFYSAGRMLIPAIHGLLYGDPASSELLMKAMKEVLNKHKSTD